MIRGLAILAAALLSQVSASQDVTDARISLAGTSDLERLVDLCSERLDVSIEYAPGLLRNQQSTLRLPSHVPESELWRLTNELLILRGFTTVQIPGSDNSTVVSVVKVAEAPSLARLEQSRDPTTRAWFVSVPFRPQHLATARVIDVVKPLLSRGSGTATLLGDTGSLVISDTRPRVRRLIEILDELDRPRPDVEVALLSVDYQRASDLAVTVTAAMTSRNTLEGGDLPGSLTPAPGGASLILVAPSDRMDEWKAIVEQFDRRQAVETQTYASTAFSLEEVRGLIEQAVRDPGPRGSGDQWRVVADTLTTSLIVTATPSEHERIAALFGRLEGLPGESRRSMRTFQLRNRPVDDIVQVLEGLIEAGAIDAAAVGEFETSQRPRSTSAKLDVGTNAQENVLVRSDPGTNTLIVVGEPRVLNQVADLIATLDVREPQVMLEVMIVSLSEGDTLDFGVELEKLEISGSTLVSLASIFGLGGSLDAIGRAGTGFTGVVLNPGDFSVVVRALQTTNLGRSTSFPKVLVNNNEQATLDATRNEPYISTNASSTVATTSFGGADQAGTVVTVTPYIAEGDHVVLEYSVSLSAFVGESSSPELPPPSQKNALSSKVTIPDGYTVVLGGLELVSEAEAVSKVPLLGDIPILGELFKSRSRSSSTSRFYVFIRPNVMRNDGFEDLKYASDLALREVELDDGWPEVLPRIIK